MAKVKVENNRYTVDSLYQWDLNQVLQIYGLSLPSVPEIHFSNADMDRAIVRPATMDAAGIITVDVPNSMLQKAGKLNVYICDYEGETFRTLYKLEITVKARVKPYDYTLTDDPEVYSFNALENKLDNIVVELQVQYDDFTDDAQKKLDAYENTLDAYANTIEKLISGYVLLWENPSPQSSFSEQDVALDMDIYNLLYVEFYGQVGGSLFGILAYAKDAGASYHAAAYIAGYTFSRVVTITENGLHFGGGSGTDSDGGVWTDDGYAIPRRIWGLR